MKRSESSSPQIATKKQKLCSDDLFNASASHPFFVARSGKDCSLRTLKTAFARLGALMKVCFPATEMSSLFNMFIGGMPDEDQTLNSAGLVALGATVEERVEAIDAKLTDYLNKAFAIDIQDDFKPLFDAMDLKKTNWTNDEQILIALRCFSLYGRVIFKMIVECYSILTEHMEEYALSEKRMQCLNEFEESFCMFQHMFDESMNTSVVVKALRDLIAGKPERHGIIEMVSDDGMYFDIDDIFLDDDEKYAVENDEEDKEEENEEEC